MISLFSISLNRSILHTFIFIACFCSQAFTQRALDTVDTEVGKVIIYSNKTWALYNPFKFDGIMNPRIHKIMTTEQETPYSLTWNNDVCFGTKNDLSKLKDTVWLCVNDELNSAFTMPRKGIVTSRYGFRSGRYHNGIDIGLNVGDTVYATWDGKVRYAKFNDGGFGNLVILRHFNGLETYHAHLSKLLVYPDQNVKSGDPIGLGGNTGHSFGPHLHFEVRFYDVPMNPEEIIDFDKKVMKDENLMVHKGLFRPGAKPTDYYENQPDGTIAATKPSPAPVKTSQLKYYRVKPGDSLTEIADRNKTTVSKLCELNGIKPSSVLQAGKSLRIK